MISLICFILTLLGSINWFCIGVLQYDFVAGIFGSQANVFSRIIYALIGLSSIWLVYATIKGKGKLKVDGKKSTDKQLLTTKKAEASIEASESVDNQNHNSFNGFGSAPYNMSQTHLDMPYNRRDDYNRNYHSPRDNDMDR